MRTTIIYITLALLCIVTGSSCRKVYYDCTCAYESQNGVDTTLLAVRATNRKKAAQLCADAEVKVAVQKGDFLYCRLK